MSYIDKAVGIGRETLETLYKVWRCYPSDASIFNP